MKKKSSYWQGILHLPFIPLWVRAIYLCGLLLCLNPFVASAQNYSGPNMTYSYNGPSISDAQIYANPTDEYLNLNYARQEAARGNLLASSAALERLLYKEPNWHSVRLFYAAVLYRLDDKTAALRELHLLDEAPLNAEQRAVYEDYKFAFADAPPVTAQTTIDGRSTAELLARGGVETSEAGSDSATPTPSHSDGAQIDGRLAAGIRYDNNAGNAITDLGLGDGQADGSLFGQGAIRLRRPVFETGNGVLHGSVNGQFRRHDDYSQADFSTGGVRIGGSVKNETVTLMAELQADQVNIDEQKYLFQSGPRVLASVDIGPQTQLSVSAASYNQSFKALSFAPNERARSGNKSVILATISHSLNQRSEVTATVGLENKTAQDSALSYDAVRASAHMQTALTELIDLKLDASVRQLEFDAAPNMSGAEDRLNLRAALKLPAAMFLPSGLETETLEQTLGGVNVELAVNYNQRVIANSASDFSNLGGELRLSWDF